MTAQLDPKDPPECGTCGSTYALYYVEGIGVWAWRRDCRGHRQKKLLADPGDPQPTLYPQCSECGVRYVLRRALQITTGTWSWAWFRDCKHKQAMPTIMDRGVSVAATVTPVKRVQPKRRS